MWEFFHIWICSTFFFSASISMRCQLLLSPDPTLTISGSDSRRILEIYSVEKLLFPLKYLFCAPRRLTVHSRGEERHSNFLAFSSDERKVLVWQLQIGLEWELPFWLYGWKSCFSSSINSNNNSNTTTAAIILAKIWMAINSSSYSSKSSSNNNNSSSAAITAAATPATEQLTSAIAATTAPAIKAAATTNNICTSNYVVKDCLSANLVFPIRLSPAVGSVVGGIQSSLCEPE